MALQGSTIAYVPNVDIKKVGINLTVKPHINTNKFVAMEIKQNIDDLSGFQTIDNVAWPIVETRTLSASVAVRSGDTIVLGGLMANSRSEVSSKIPILGDIPLLGWLFSSHNNSGNRSEVIVFITPYVLDTSQEMEAEARRRQESMGKEGRWEKGWSDSRLSDQPKLHWWQRRPKPPAPVEAESNLFNNASGPATH